MSESDLDDPLFIQSINFEELDKEIEINCAKLERKISSLPHLHDENINCIEKVSNSIAQNVPYEKFTKDNILTASNSSLSLKNTRESKAKPSCRLSDSRIIAMNDTKDSIAQVVVNVSIPPKKDNTKENYNINRKSPILFSSRNGTKSYSKFSIKLKPKIKNEHIEHKLNTQTLGSDFSQFCKSSQVVKQLDEVTNNSEICTKQSTTIKTVLHQNKNDKSYSFKRPTFENKEKCKVLKVDAFQNHDEAGTLFNNSVMEKMTQLINSCEYRKEVTEIFDKMEHKICHLGVKNDSFQLSLQCGQNDNLNWADDTLMTDAILNGFTQEIESDSIGDKLKRALTKNANRTIVSDNLSNRTVLSVKYTFQKLGPFYGLPSDVKELIKLYKGIDQLYGLYLD